MSAEFVDTNVLLYLASADAAKADRAEEVVAGAAVISVQVLNEVANVLRRKFAWPWPEARRFLHEVRALFSIVQPLTVAVHERGLGLAERYGLSIYAASIVAAALEAGCSILWSEDMQDGLVVERVLTIRDPFRARRG